MNEQEVHLNIAKTELESRKKNANIAVLDDEEHF